MGLGEREALAKYGENKILFGIGRYEDTAKGIAMGIKDYFKSYCEGWARNHRCSYYRTICIGAHSGDNQCHVYIARAHYEAYLKCHAHTSCPKRSSPKKRFFLMPPQQYHHLMAEHYGLSRDRENLLSLSSYRA